ncbi:MAG: winged helix-turn-helix domain-containing protein [Actinomycetota bacterium]
MELPPMEFSILAVLAARPGEVVSHKELLTEAFGDSAYMDAQDLHWRIWNIRQLIGDGDKTLVRNRRGQGFVIDAGRVEVVEGLVEPEPVDETPVPQGPIVIRLEEPEPTEATPPNELPAEPKEVDKRSRPFVFSPLALVIVGLVAGLALGGSWLAGYTLSQRGTPAGVEPPSPPRDSERTSEEPRSREDNKKQSPRRSNTRDNRGNTNTNVAAGPVADGLGTGDITSGNTTTGDSNSGETATGSGPGGKEEKPAPPPPPQPDAQLYHLHNPETGDHIMTMSSSIANQKQAQGYDSTLEGGVFTTQEKGTVAISLDSGSAFVYSNSSSAPDGVSVTALYRLSSDGDFFYTTSSSLANQAQAQGWSRSTSGYVSS